MIRLASEDRLAIRLFYLRLGRVCEAAYRECLCRLKVPAYLVRMVIVAGDGAGAEALPPVQKLDGSHVAYLVDVDYRSQAAH